MDKKKVDAVNTIANSMIGCGCLMFLLIVLGMVVGIAIFR